MNKFAMENPETALLSSRFVAFDSRLRHILRLLYLSTAMIKFVNESGSINYCLCAPLVSCTIMYCFLGKGYAYTFLVKNICREGGVQSTLFCIFNHCYFISCLNKLKICHTIKQLYIHNIMPKHENNALHKKLYSQFEKGTFSVQYVPGIGHTRHEHGVHRSIKSWVACIA